MSKQAAVAPPSAATLVARVLAIEDEVADLEAKVKAKEAERRSILTDLLPAAMQEAELEQFKTTDGTTVTLKQVVSAHVSEEHRAAAHEWLRANGHGSIVKNEVVATFSAGEDEKASLATQTLEALGFVTTRKESVHPSTLKAFCREQVESGTPPPTDLFGLHVQDEAVLKQPRRRS